MKFPSPIDIHVHLRDPGQTYKEDFSTGTSAALNGGITTVFDMPNNKEPIFSEEVLKEKENIAREKAVCDYGFYFGSTGENIHEFEKVCDRVVGLKLYLDQTTGNYLIDNVSLIRKVFMFWPKDKIIMIHGEGEHIDLVLSLSRKLGNKIHVTHILKKSELEKIITAKKNGINITCDVTPHHLFLTEQNIIELKGKGLVKPSLGTVNDTSYLWDNLSWIDCFASDHAPHTETEKNSPSTPYGIPGLDTMIPLFLTAVKDGSLDMDDLILKISTNPHKIFDIPVNKDTYTEVETDENYELKKENLKTKCAWSPYEGWQLHARVKSVYIRGTKVIEDGNILVKPGFGRNVMDLSFRA